MICLAGGCVQTACGDGYVDISAGEQCEDGNTIPGDGCETCRFTCIDNSGCDDGSVCTGIEVCQADHTCTTPAPMNCDDANPCTADSCHPVDGCVHTLIDGDGDGFAPESLGACAGATRGGDCVDTDPSVYPTAPDGCGGGEGVNNDCDSQVDEDATARWYVDCDGDGFTPHTSGSMETCDMPAVAPSGCSSSGGSWTNRAPIGSTQTDCDDSNGTVYPGSTEVTADGIDQNCDGREACYVDADEDTYRTDQTTVSEDTECRTSEGHARADQQLEWTREGARALCCDQDPNMHRGQRSFFSFEDYPAGGVTACPAGRRWDFNCDGEQSMRWDDRVAGCFWEPAGCSRGGVRNTRGWYNLSSPPACGHPGAAWVSNCNSSCPGEPFCTSCSWQSFQIRRQECR